MIEKERSTEKLRVRQADFAIQALGKALKMGRSYAPSSLLQDPVLAELAKELAKMLSLSKRQIFRLNSCGKIPVPIRIGGAVRWDSQECAGWLAAGAPDRRIWEAMKEELQHG